MTPHRVAFKQILCPTDFSEFSERAFGLAKEIARWSGAHLTALHAMPPLPPFLQAGGMMDAPALPMPEGLLREVRSEAARELQRFVGHPPPLDPPVSTLLLEGTDAWRQIEAVADALPADLIVMGTHGRSGWNRLVLGSTTEKLIRRALCPVLTVGEHVSNPVAPHFHRILCAADLTAASRQTIDLAFAFAEENQAHLTLLHVVEGGLGAKRVRTGILDSALEQLHREAAAPHAFCNVATRVETGNAWTEILRVAAEARADLIVLGAHVNDAFGRFFLGSTANQVVRHAPCPVLIAREVPARARSLERDAGALSLADGLPALTGVD